METAYLKEFIVFSKTLNFAQTAKELYLSQPTLRAHIKSLETEVGANLIAKRDGKYDLTLSGRIFLSKSYELLEHVEAVFDECREAAHDSVSLMIGDLDNMSFLEAIDEARRLHNSRNKNAVEIKIASGMRSNIESLEDKSVDIILFSHVRRRDENRRPLELPGEIQSCFLKTVRMMFWVTKDNPLFEKECVSAQDLAGQTLLLGPSRNMEEAGELVQRALEAHGVHVVMSSCPFNSYLEYFMSGTKTTFGITQEESIPMRPGVKVFEIKEVKFSSDLYALARLEEDQACAKLFFEVLKTTLEEYFTQE